MSCLSLSWRCQWNLCRTWWWGDLVPEWVWTPWSHESWWYLRWSLGSPFAGRRRMVREGWSHFWGRCCVYLCRLVRRVLRFVRCSTEQGCHSVGLSADSTTYTELFSTIKDTFILNYRKSCNTAWLNQDKSRSVSRTSSSCGISTNVGLVLIFMMTYLTTQMMSSTPKQALKIAIGTFQLFF